MTLDHQSQEDDPEGDPGAGAWQVAEVTKEPQVQHDSQHHS